MSILELIRTADTKEKLKKAVDFSEKARNEYASKVTQRRHARAIRDALKRIS